MRRRWNRMAASSAAIAVVAAMMSTGAAVQEPPTPATEPTAVGSGGPSAEQGSARRVTLITGDGVVLDAAGTVRSIVPARGREHIPVSTSMRDGRTLVLPADAERLVARGVLDERLFDVTGLVEAGYDDAGRDTLPIIVTGRTGGAASTGGQGRAHAAVRAADGADVTRELPSIDGTAVEVDRDAGARFWDSITDRVVNGAAESARSMDSGIGKVWLDGRMEAALDESVPQVGAPEAWAAGFDGEGVTVAVLDSGIDDTHPDVAGRITAAENFTDSGDAVDRAGHGTHVASTVAGSGAASDGSHRGVAPGARLLNGKVLDDDGFGSASSIVAGMEWAVGQGAKVVNLSLGASDMPGLDPVEQAVEALTEQSGTLFVVAAGNDGRWSAGTVNSPASAPSALAVGAVDKQDHLADFSSWGPTAEHALKPDVSAPGVGIAAARAKGTDGSGPYVSFSGTSMATPHVAGAAAILAQQHPDWQAGELKSALMASAQPSETSAYAQGSGRLDVAGAVTQTVTTDPAAVDFGLHEYPHEQPDSRELTYRNTGDEPVELDLAIRAAGPEGEPAPEGMFTLDTTEITVPAGGAASVTVTVGARPDGRYGAYGGTVIATDDDADVSVSTGVGVWKQIPMYDMTLTFLDDDGEPATDAFGEVMGLGVDFGDRFYPEDDGRVTIRVPAGEYYINSKIWTGGEDEIAPLLLVPKINIASDTEIVLDARLAEPFDITMPNPDAAPAWSQYSYNISTDEGISVGDTWRNFDGGRMRSASRSWDRRRRMSNSRQSSLAAGRLSRRASGTTPPGTGPAPCWPG